MEGIGGLAARSFKLFLGNPDVMISLLTWSVVAVMICVILNVRQKV